MLRLLCSTSAVLTLAAIGVLAMTRTTVAAEPVAPVASFQEFDRRAKNGEALNVVFFGGSLTWGANATDPQRTSYRGLMSDYLRQRYPKAPLVFHDAAIGGTGSKLGMFRLERDVLSRKPDLVLLDFSANDGMWDSDVPTLASYESLLREMIGKGIPVEQVFLGFKFNVGAQWAPEKVQRVIDHKKLAAAYGTATADALSHIQDELTAGRAKIDTLWPIDGAHPDDPGYRLFFEAARDGFDQGVREGRVCKVPKEPVFSAEYMTRKRIRLVDSPLPTGWHRVKTYRTSMWFDGLASRWMDDVACCDAKDKDTVAPLKMEFEGTMVGIFGEAEDEGVPFKVLIDGKPVMYHPNPKVPASETWTWGMKVGRLFAWRELANSLTPGKHTLEIQPVFVAEKPKGQLRIESVCVAGATK